MTNVPYETADLSGYRTIPCNPYYATNDHWRPNITEAIAEQQRLPGTAETTALICGPGGLPYLLGILGVGEIVQIDLEPTVLETTQSRLQCLTESLSWEDFLENDLCIAHDSHRTLGAIVVEYSTLEYAGLCTPERFDIAKQAASIVKFTSIAGNILEAGEQIASHLQQSSRPLSLAHMTNVADYIINNTYMKGYGPLAATLAGLPRTDNFMVAHSINTNEPDSGVCMFVEDLATYAQGII